MNVTGMASGRDRNLDVGTEWGQKVIPVSLSNLDANI